MTNSMGCVAIVSRLLSMAKARSGRSTMTPTITLTALLLTLCMARAEASITQIDESAFSPTTPVATFETMTPYVRYDSWSEHGYTFSAPNSQLSYANGTCFERYGATPQGDEKPIAATFSIPMVKAGVRANSEYTTTWVRARIFSDIEGRDLIGEVLLVAPQGNPCWYPALQSSLPFLRIEWGSADSEGTLTARTWVDDFRAEPGEVNALTLEDVEIDCDSQETQVRIRTVCPVEAVSFGVSADPAIAKAASFTPMPVWGGMQPEFLSVSIDAINLDNACPQHRLGITVAMVGSLSDPVAYSIATGDHVLGLIRFQLQPGSDVGDESPLVLGSCLSPSEGLPAVQVRTVCEGVNVITETVSGRLSKRSECFQRGYCNPDNSFDIADPVFLLLRLFAGRSGPSCDNACDINDDGTLDVSDSVAMLQNLFRGSANPPEPWVRCGPDGSLDTLECAYSSLCK